MPTENRRIATYLPKEVDEKFKAFKLERGIKGDSQALLVIMSDFLGLSGSVTPLAITQYEELAQQLADLRSELTSLESKLLSRLKTELLGEVSKVEVEDVDDAPPLLEPSSVADLPIVDQAPENPLPSIQTNEICLSGATLQKRLKAASSTMSNKKRSSADVFAAWPEKLDPDNVSWRVNDDGTFSPIGEISSDVVEALKPKKLEGLSNGDLAKRLRMDGSTLSHWKKDKSPEEMLKAIREKDPDGIGWVFDKDSGRFIEETGNSLRMTQGELPEVLSQDCQDF